MPFFSSFIISAYKLAGIAALVSILSGLAGYIGKNLFFLVDETWISPTVISPHDERVLQLNAQYAQQSSLREKLAAERYELSARRADALRTADSQCRFQAGYWRALEEDRKAKVKTLGKLEHLQARYAGSKSRIVGSNEVFSAFSRNRLESLAAAHLLENDGVISGQFQLSQIEHSNLTLDEKEVMLGNQKDAIGREVDALHRVLDERKAFGVAGALSYETLRLEQEYEKSMLERYKASDIGEALDRAIEAADATLARYDRLLQGIKESPYMRAAQHSLTIAAVPYENASTAKAGAPLYACRIGFLLCSKVGHVVESIEGEVPVRHPLHSQFLRGQLVQLELTDPSAIERQVLFAGRPPLFF
jgi:hypothetical protein